MNTLTHAYWEQRAKVLKVEGRAFINGEYTAAVSGETLECLSPIDGRLLAKVASCDSVDANRAVDNARDTVYGLAAAVWSADLSKAHLTAKVLRAGSVWINQ